MLSRLAVVYGQPDSPDPVAFLGEFSKLLATYSEATLDAATDQVLKTHRGRNWPTPAECFAACQDVLEADRAAEARRPSTFDAHPSWSPSTIDLADKLIQSPMGRTAAGEGWISALWDYCRNAGALPDDEAAIHRCKVIARGFDEAYAQVSRGEGQPGLSAALTMLGDSMLERRNKLAAIALGKAA